MTSNERVAIVTGGASGIGQAVVERLADRGMHVVVADVDDDRGNAVANNVGGVFVECDVRDPAAHERVVAAAESAYGGLDVIHLNAGVTTGERDLASLSLESYRRIMAINLDGVVFGVRAALPALRRRGGGVIVATASLSGLTAYSADPIYAMTKHGVVGLTRALGDMHAADNIRVNCVCPGFVDTPLLANYAEIFRAAGFPLLEPGDVAAGVLAAIDSEGTGEAWVVQPGRDPLPYGFRGVPGPRAEGAAGMAPPPPPA